MKTIGKIGMILLAVAAIGSASMTAVGDSALKSGMKSGEEGKSITIEPSGAYKGRIKYFNGSELRFSYDGSKISARLSGRKFAVYVSKSAASEAVHEGMDGLLANYKIALKDKSSDVIAYNQ